MVFKEGREALDSSWSLLRRSGVEAFQIELVGYGVAVLLRHVEDLVQATVLDPEERETAHGRLRAGVEEALRITLNVCGEILHEDVVATLQSGVGTALHDLQVEGVGLGHLGDEPAGRTSDHDDHQTPRLQVDSVGHEHLPFMLLNMISIKKESKSQYKEAGF